MSEHNTVETLHQLSQSFDVRKAGNHPFVILPKDAKIHSVEQLLRRPETIKTTVTTDSIESFIAYYTEFEKHHSLIFADHPNLRITGIIDYHESEDAPGWCQHRVEYKCPLSRQWQRWNEVNQKYLSQTQFAEFIEDNIADIVHPDGQELMEMVLQFQQIQKAVFGSSHRLQSGEFSIQYSQENQKGTFELPETITLGIPVFHNGEKYEVKAKLRYRIKEGELKLMLALKESERITEDAFTGVIKKIQPDCTNVVIEGTAPHQSTHYSI